MGDYHYGGFYALSPTLLCNGGKSGEEDTRKGPPHHLPSTPVPTVTCMQEGRGRGGVVAEGRPLAGAFRPSSTVLLKTVGERGDFMGRNGLGSPFGMEDEIALI